MCQSCCIFPSNILGHLTNPWVCCFILTFLSEVLFSQSVCRVLFIWGDLRGARLYLSHETAILIANALVSSSLKALSRSFLKFNLDKLHSIQNSFARLVINNNVHVIPILGSLCWLSIEYCSNFKHL